MSECTVEDLIKHARKVLMDHSQVTGVSRLVNVCKALIIALERLREVQTKAAKELDRLPLKLKRNRKDAHEPRISRKRRA